MDFLCHSENDVALSQGKDSVIVHFGFDQSYNGNNNWRSKDMVQYMVILLLLINNLGLISTEDDKAILRMVTHVKFYHGESFGITLVGFYEIFNNKFLCLFFN